MSPIHLRMQVEDKNKRFWARTRKGNSLMHRLPTLVLEYPIVHIFIVFSATTHLIKLIS